MTSSATFDVLCWLLVAGLSLIVFIWTIAVQLDRIERDRFDDQRRGGRA